MSKLPELILTKAGAAMLAKTPIGSEIPVTKWRIGDGQLPGGEDPRDRTQLVNPVRELPIASVKNDGNQCLIKGQLVNTEMAAFTWRETGLYATDPDDGEILYAYGYEADGAEIPAGATQLREVEFGVKLVFDTAANVTAVISKTLVFATLSDLEQTKADAVEETLEQIITSPAAEDLTDSDAFATVTAAGIKRTPLSLLKQVFVKLFAPAPLTQNLALYVNAATGSDSNDGLTAEQPKKTIMAAVNAIPKNLGGYYAKINIADGTYPESVDINGFYGSNRGNLYGVQLVGTSQETVSITGGIAAMGCRAPLLIQGVSVSGTNSGNVVSFRQCGIVTILTTSVDGQPVVSNGAAVLFESTNGVLRELKVDNCPGMAVCVTGGTAYLQLLSGENNEIGVQAGNSAYGFPGLVVVGTNTMTANTKYSKVLGGAIIENGVLV